MFFAGIERQGEGEFAPLTEAADRREITPTDKTKPVRAVFLDGKEPAWTPAVRSREPLAKWLASPDNPYFARATVNRLWGQFFGTGLVDPVDGFHDENARSHPELLDDLAGAFVDSGFDLRYVVRAIGRSRAYRLSSVRKHPSQDDRPARRPEGLRPARLDAAGVVGGVRPDADHQPGTGRGHDLIAWSVVLGGGIAGGRAVGDDWQGRPRRRGAAGRRAGLARHLRRRPGDRPEEAEHVERRPADPRRRFGRQARRGGSDVIGFLATAALMLRRDSRAARPLPAGASASGAARRQPAGVGARTGGLTPRRSRIECIAFVRLLATAALLASAAAGRAADAVDLLVPARVRVEVAVAGDALSVRWAKFYDELFAHFDRDGDGTLSMAEAGRVLPSAGKAPIARDFAKADADRDGKLTPAEFRNYYRAAGFAPVVAVVTAPTADDDAVNDILFRRLDADDDGFVSVAEAEAAAGR